MAAVYDDIGYGYVVTRQPDPRLARAIREALGEARPLPIPHDCQDGFLGAFWRRPEAYLDPHIRRAMSGFTQLAPQVVQTGLAQLAMDLRSGRWDEQFGWLRRQESLDLDYRVVIAQK